MWGFGLNDLEVKFVGLGDSENGIGASIPLRRLRGISRGDGRGESRIFSEGKRNPERETEKGNKRLFSKSIAFLTLYEYNLPNAMTTCWENSAVGQ